MPIKDCCRDPGNLSAPVPTGAKNETMRRCRVCNCRHFRVKADKGMLKAFLRGKPGAAAPSR